jgi:Rrf2 family iron-sulfur cluster assembly transcriptional regulator
MNRVHKNVEYGLMALQLMHLRSSVDSERLFSAKEIAQATGAPAELTARVLQKLAQKKFVHAEMGARGGYRLQRNLSEVSFLELMEALQGPLKITSCIKQEESCGLESQCNLMGAMQNLNRKMTDFYASLRLSELLRMS